MEKIVLEYIEYLRNTRGASENTQMAYQRDLRKLEKYMAEKKIDDLRKMSASHLNDYVELMRERGFTDTTISRNIASIRGFFAYLADCGRIEEDIAAELFPPRIEKKEPKKAAKEDIEKMLCASSGKSPKILRDKAMIEILYSTGIMVEELVGLKMGNIDMSARGIFLEAIGEEAPSPMDRQAQKALRAYLKNGRDQLLKGRESDVLFPNISGKRMSRQGFWKILRGYALKAGIEGNITPSMLKHRDDSLH